MRQKVKITDPAALAIVREIHTESESIAKLADELQKEFTQRMDALVEKVNKSVDENTERLRFALGMPAMILPKLDTQYLELGVAFLHHGTIEGEVDEHKANLMRMFHPGCDH